MSEARRALSLYRSLLRTSRDMKQYNFREWSKRSVRERFREHRDEQDSERVAELLREAESNLAMLKRQSTISQMYAHDKNVVEEVKR